MSLVEIKDLKAQIDSKPFFDQPMKNLLKFQKIMITQQKTYQIIRAVKIIINSLVQIQTNMTISQQTNFIKKETNDGATMFFIFEKRQKKLF